MNGLDFGTAIGLIKGLGSPDPAVIESAVSDWLDDHPEATTTVQDGSITKAKLDSNLQGTVDDVANLKSQIAINKPNFLSENVSAAFSIDGIIQSNGTLRTDIGKSTDYLEITQRNKLYWNISNSNNNTGYYHVAFFDADKNVIPAISIPTGSGTTRSGIIDLSQSAYASAKYVRASVNTRTDYIVAASNLVLSDENAIGNDHLSPVFREVLYSGANEQNEVYYLTIQGEIDSSGYIRTSGTNKRISEFIPLENVAKIVVDTIGNGNGLFFYDTAKRYLSELTVAIRNNGYFEEVLTNDYADARYCRFQGYDGSSVFSPDLYRLKLVKNNPRGVNKFNGKNVLIFGDSITNGSTITVNSDNETTAYAPAKAQANANGRKMWPNILKDEYNFGEVRDYALSGASWKKNSTTARMSAWSQVTIALNDLDNPNNVFPSATFAPDIVIFALGINDGDTPNDTFETAMAKTVYYSNNVTIDLDATLANLDVTKTFEAMRWALLTIKKQFPSAMVFVSLPLQCAKDSNIYESVLMRDIERMAERCGCVIISSTNESGIIPEGNFYNYDGTGTTLQDGLHPNKLGQQMLARTIIKALNDNYVPLNF